MLSPSTAQSLIRPLSHPDLLPDDLSSSSDSPNSLYSHGSPTLASQTPFEFDDFPEHVTGSAPRTHREVEEVDEDDYESVMSGEQYQQQQQQEWDSPGWGHWPESATSGPSWTPVPKSASLRTGSIISISPRGSLSNYNGSNNNSRQGSSRTSNSISRLSETGDSRRGSDPSLLGFDLAQRRRSSAKSCASSMNRSNRNSLSQSFRSNNDSIRDFMRRRSSAFSTSSFASQLDPIEDARLRHIASMNLLIRRFSEVVEVASPDEDDFDLDLSWDGDEQDQTARARAIMSAWSPYSTDSEISEIRTAPYVPTPPIAPVVPSLLSNFPLSSVAREQVSQTPSDLQSEDEGPAAVSSMSLNRRRSVDFRLPFTPPAPPQPSYLIKARSRPAFDRALSKFAFPPRNEGVPLGAAAPRPLFPRSLSNPIFSSAQGAAPTERIAALNLEKRARGTFPLAREKPLGRSRLSESLRRQSIVSDGSSRRSSVAVVGSRKSSLLLSSSAPTRRSSNDLRRQSFESRRGSNAASGSTKPSLAPSMSSSSSLRKASLGPSIRRTSQASRKSSVMSIGEYGYLAPQIVIDPSSPPADASEIMTPLALTHIIEPPVIPHHHQHQQPEMQSLRFRRNAPPSIVLPVYSFPTSTTSPTFSSASTPTPRFNPLDSFLGRTSTSPQSSPATSPGCIVTPRSPFGQITPAGPFAFPESKDTQTEAPAIDPLSPRVSSIMDRGRPVSSPEFVAHHPFLANQGQTSPKSRSVATHSHPNSSPRQGSAKVTKVPVQLNGEQQLRMASNPRVPVPQLSSEDLRTEAGERQCRDRDTHTRHAQTLEFQDIMPRSEMLHQARGATSAVGTTGPDGTLSLGLGTGRLGHKCSESAELGSGSRPAQKRPSPRRTTTAPVLMTNNMKATNTEAAQPHGIKDVQVMLHAKRAEGAVSTQAEGRGGVGHLGVKVQRGRGHTVTFSAGPELNVAGPSKPPMNRQSSFTRFFHRKSHSVVAADPSITPQTTASRPPSSPISLQSTSSSSGSAVSCASAPVLGGQKASSSTPKRPISLDSKALSMLKGRSGLNSTHQVSMGPQAIGTGMRSPSSTHSSGQGSSESHLASDVRDKFRRFGLTSPKR